jgi:hypothetical protein
MWRLNDVIYDRGAQVYWRWTGTELVRIDPVPPEEVTCVAHFDHFGYSDDDENDEKDGSTAEES